MGYERIFRPLRKVRFGEWHRDRVLTRLWNHNRFGIKELSIVEISGEFGKVPTKAAVFAGSLDQGRYILGKRKAALIEKNKMGKFTGIKPIKTVQTRSKTRAMEKEMAEKESDSQEIIVEKNGINKTENAFQLESHTEVIKISDLSNKSEELT
ncbi:hypothetical protein AVEN_75152-1 [Araneus ventricosus]|uniref:Uncharacterized protein n=1 Tax=Araneus ventricosus TaxID=182803 RepID=A0A4Y2MU00_ARAVE|nr:hypothetical protein AVEN_75152-1 [Araneus ventricosus]